MKGGHLSTDVLPGVRGCYALVQLCAWSLCIIMRLVHPSPFPPSFLLFAALTHVPGALVSHTLRAMLLSSSTATGSVRFFWAQVLGNDVTRREYDQFGSSTTHSPHQEHPFDPQEVFRNFEKTFGERLGMRIEQKPPGHGRDVHVCNVVCVSSS